MPYLPKNTKLFATTLGVIGSLSALGLAKFFLYNSFLVTEKGTVGLEGLFDFFFVFPGAISLIIGGILGLVSCAKLQNNRPKEALSLFHPSLGFVLVPALLICILSHTIISVAITSILCLILAIIFTRKTSKEITNINASETEEKKLFFEKLLKRMSIIGSFILFLSFFLYFPSRIENGGIGRGGFFMSFLALLMTLFGLTEVFVKNYRRAAIIFLIIGIMLFLITPAHPIDIIILLIIFFIFIGIGLIGLSGILKHNPPKKMRVRYTPNSKQ